MKITKEQIKPFLRRAFKEAVQDGITSGTPGTGRTWSISAADLQKKAQDPTFIAKLKQHSPLPGADVAVDVAKMVPAHAISNMSDEAFAGFVKKLGEILSVERYKIQQKAARSPATGVGAQPVRSLTQTQTKPIGPVKQ